MGPFIEGGPPYIAGRYRMTAGDRTFTHFVDPQITDRFVYHVYLADERGGYTFSHTVDDAAR